jgi:hypothetical protein
MAQKILQMLFATDFTVFIIFPFGLQVTGSTCGRLSVFTISTSTDIYMLQSHIITKDNGQSQLNICSRRITMLSFLKKIFGAKPAAKSPAPYKVEASEHFPFPKTVKEEKKPVAKKSAGAKKPAAKKPKKEKAPKS